MELGFDKYVTLLFLRFSKEWKFPCLVRYPGQIAIDTKGSSFSQGVAAAIDTPRDNKAHVIDHYWPQSIGLMISLYACSTVRVYQNCTSQQIARQIELTTTVEHCKS